MYLNELRYFTRIKYTVPSWTWSWGQASIPTEILQVRIGRGRYYLGNSINYKNVRSGLPNLTVWGIHCGTRLDSLGKSAVHKLSDKAVDWALDKGLRAALPWVISGVTIVTSFLEHIPASTVILLIALVFWAVAAGINSFDQLVSRRTAQSKISFGNALMNLNIDAQTQKAKGAQFGFEITNNADFPVEYEVDEISSSIAGRINPNPVHTNRGTVLEPRSASVHWDAQIPFDDTMLGKQIEGLLEIKIRYGRPGRLTYSNSRAVQLIAFIGDQGKLSFNWMSKPKPH